MKDRAYVATCLVVGAIACGGSPRDELIQKPGSKQELGCDDPLKVCETLGTSTYFLQNNSEFDLTVRFLKMPRLGSETKDVVVAFRTVVKIAGDSLFGVSPLPTDTFERLVLLADPPPYGDPVAVYEQDPVDDALWIVDRSGSGPHSYFTEYTLVIVGGDLAF